MKRILCFALLASVAFVSCQKQLGFDTPPDTGSNGGTGNGSTNTDCKACIYMPVCNGTVLSYLDTNTAGNTISVDTLRFVKDTSIDSKIFNKIYSTGSKTNSYYNCTDGATRVIGYDSKTTNGYTVSAADATVLKANLPVGGTWTDKILNPIGQEAIYNSTIAEKGITRTLNGKTYNDVIHVHVETGIDVPVIGFTVVGVTDYYFAKGIGLIEGLVVSATDGQTIQHRVLKAYYIP